MAFEGFVRSALRELKVAASVVASSPVRPGREDDVAASWLACETHVPMKIRRSNIVRRTILSMSSLHHGPTLRVQSWQNPVRTCNVVFSVFAKTVNVEVCLIRGKGRPETSSPSDGPGVVSISERKEEVKPRLH